MVPNERGDAAWAWRLMPKPDHDGSPRIFVAIDDRAARALIFADRIRTEAPQAICRLRAAGISRVVMVTGDRADVADRVSTALGLVAVYAELTPAGKVAIVEAESAQGATVMIGDGVNDAPARAAPQHRRRRPTSCFSWIVWIASQTP